MPGLIRDWRDRAWTGRVPIVDALIAFGLFAVTFMPVCYMLEERAPFWTLLVALGCLMGSAYGFMQGAWPFGAVELIWFVVALGRLEVAPPRAVIALPIGPRHRASGCEQRKQRAFWRRWRSRGAAPLPTR